MRLGRLFPILLLCACVALIGRTLWFGSVGKKRLDDVTENLVINAACERLLEQSGQTVAFCSADVLTVLEALSGEWVKMDVAGNLEPSPFYGSGDDTGDWFAKFDFGRDGRLVAYERTESGTRRIMELLTSESHGLGIPDTVYVYWGKSSASTGRKGRRRAPDSQTDEFRDKTTS